MPDTPLIRDLLVIDDTVQQYYNGFTGDGPVFLLGRLVQHKPGYVLKLGTRPLVIVADEYQGNGGAVDGSGRVKNTAAPTAGANGVNGADCSFRKVAVHSQGALHPTTTYKFVPTSAGKPGTAGGNGSDGSLGTDLTLMCRTGSGVRIPTGGASLVALVPSLLVLTSTVLEEAPRVAKAVFEGDKPDLYDIDKAYTKVGEKVKAVVAAGQTVINFINVVKKIGEASTPENAESIALIKRGAELTHQVLLAKTTLC